MTLPEILERLQAEQEWTHSEFSKTVLLLSVDDGLDKAACCYSIRDRFLIQEEHNRTLAKLKATAKALKTAYAHIKDTADSSMALLGLETIDHKILAEITAQLSAAIEEGV